MDHPDYPHLFRPIRIGDFEVPNRVCHVPTDISSVNADGSVNQRVITYHEQIAKGGADSLSLGPRRRIVLLAGLPSPASLIKETQI